MMASSGFYFEEENSCGAVVAAQAMCAIFWKVTAGQLRDVGHTHTHTHTHTHGGFGFKGERQLANWQYFRVESRIKWQAVGI